MKSMQTMRHILLGLSLAASPLALAACEDQGPAEETGEAIDDATEEAGEDLEEAGEGIQERAD